MKDKEHADKSTSNNANVADDKPEDNKNNISSKNKLFKYKDGSTTRVVYDHKDQEYIEIVYKR